jgi:putative DNA-invertase from lambdoid prophage Rac
MARTFLYTRVSTIGQTTENQVGEVKAAGFAVQSSRIITETISGSAPAMQRPAFRRLVDRLEADDVLVVTKLDRLGRNAMDVRSTVDALAAIGVRVHCLALGGVDLTSSAGRMTMQVIAAVAEFERDLLVERTQAGLSRARSTGKALGRPASLTEEQKRQIIARLDAGSSVSALAREYQTSRQTIIRARFRLTSTPSDRTL